MGEIVGSSNYVEPYIRGGCVNYDCDLITLDAKNLGLDFKIIPAGMILWGDMKSLITSSCKAKPVQKSVCRSEGYNPPICVVHMIILLGRASWHKMANIQTQYQTSLNSAMIVKIVSDTYCETANEFVIDGIYTCEGYRLPTYAELEYAQRAGTDKDFGHQMVSRSFIKSVSRLKCFL